MAENPEKAEQEVADLAEDLETDAERLEKHGDEVSEHIDETRDDWEGKRADGSVPGAEPPSDAPA
jgi:chaperonin cofactor prefoldin